jgi:drug/metabolite transporter (DMT)-like permease
MTPTGVLAGLLGAVSFGAGDFTGAFATRRSGALIVVAGAHATGLVALLVGLVVLRPPLPPVDAVLFGMAAGVAGMVGLATLYRGMAIGSMGLVTSLAGAGSLVLPLLAAALAGASTSPVQLIGVACAALAAAAAGGASRDEVGRTALALAGAAAIGFGAWYVLLDVAASRGDPLWALVFSRAVSAALAAVVVAVRGFDRSGVPVRLVVVAGLFDVGGNALYVVAREGMHVGLAAALIGLYPIVTMLLARFVLNERLTRLGQVGVALALAGIVLISLGASEPATQVSGW